MAMVHTVTYCTAKFAKEHFAVLQVLHDHEHGLHDIRVLEHVNTAGNSSAFRLIFPSIANEFLRKPQASVWLRNRQPLLAERAVA